MNTIIFDHEAPKKSVNLSINSDLLRQAKEEKISLSRVFEESLSEVLLQKRRQNWKKENADAIIAYNMRIESSGVFSDGLRRF